MTLHNVNPCSCGWTASTPKLSAERAENISFIIGYRISCIGCTKNTGYLDSIAEAITYWNDMTKNSPGRDKAKVLALCIEKL